MLLNKDLACVGGKLKSVVCGVELFVEFDLDGVEKLGIARFQNHFFLADGSSDAKG